MHQRYTEKLPEKTGLTPKKLLKWLSKSNLEQILQNVWTRLNLR